MKHRLLPVLAIVFLFITTGCSSRPVMTVAALAMGIDPFAKYCGDCPPDSSRQEITIKGTVIDVEPRYGEEDLYVTFQTDSGELLKITFFIYSFKDSSEISLLVKGRTFIIMYALSDRSYPNGLKVRVP